MICRLFYYIYNFIFARFNKPMISREDLGMESPYLNFQNDKTIIEDVYEIHNI